MCTHILFFSPIVKLPWTVNPLTLLFSCIRGHIRWWNICPQACWPFLFSSARANVAAVCLWHLLWHSEKRDLQSLHYTDIQQHRLHVMIGSLFLFLSAPLLPLLGSQRDGTGCGCRSPAVRLPWQHLSPSLGPWGTADNTWASEPDSKLEHSKRAFS